MSKEQLERLKEVLRYEIDIMVGKMDFFEGQGQADMREVYNHKLSGLFIAFDHIDKFIRYVVKEE